LLLGCCGVLLLEATSADAQEQVTDPDFTPVVEAPAYLDDGPVVAIDQAHSNFHTAAGNYRPFAELLRQDGYRVRESSTKFEPGALAGIDVLIVANALPPDLSNLSQPAFTEDECDVLGEWVSAGGALLFIADHEPFGVAAGNLAGRFGIRMGKGRVFERAATEGITTQLVFSRENGLLGSHPILRGRTSREEVQVVRTFTGQSLSVPDGAAVLLQLSASAREAATPADLDAEDAAVRKRDGSSGGAGARSSSVARGAQGIAMAFGTGRVVVLGEAGFLSAQLIRFPDGRELRFGLNTSGHDNQQFALNVLHWLTRLLDDGAA
jgi:hypothetical protein